MAEKEHWWPISIRTLHRWAREGERFRVAKCCEDCRDYAVTHFCPGILLPISVDIENEVELRCNERKEPIPNHVLKEVRKKW